MRFFFQPVHLGNSHTRTGRKIYEVEQSNQLYNQKGEKGIKGARAHLKNLS